MGLLIREYFMLFIYFEFICPALRRSLFFVWFARLVWSQKNTNDHRQHLFQGKFDIKVPTKITSDHVVKSWKFSSDDFTWLVEL